MADAAQKIRDRHTGMLILKSKVKQGFSKIRFEAGKQSLVVIISRITCKFHVKHDSFFGIDRDNIFV